MLPELYPLFEDFLGLLGSESAFVRVRGFRLACAQAKWDKVVKAPSGGIEGLTADGTAEQGRPPQGPALPVHHQAYQLLLLLEKQSEESAELYPLFEDFLGLLGSESSAGSPDRDGGQCRCAAGGGDG